MPNEEFGQDLLLVALDAMPQQVAVLDRSGRILLINDAWRRFNQEAQIPEGGVEAQVGDDFLSFVAQAFGDGPGDSRQDALLEIKAVLSGRRSRFSGEYRRETTNGERRFMLEAFPRKDGEGAVVIQTDITERQQADVALRESESKYRSLFTLMDQGFCIIEMIFDANGKPIDHRFLEMNRMFEQLTGMYGALGKTAREIVPDLEQHWFDVYGSVALTGRPVRFTQDSEVLGRWFDVYAFRLGEEESNKVALLFTNVTDRKRADAEKERLVKALELERSRLATVFREAPAAITTLRGPEHVFEMANPLYYQLIGRRDIIGKTVREAIPEVEGQGLFELLDHVYETGKPYKGRGVRVLLQREMDGSSSELFVDFVYQPLRELDGSVSGIFVHAVDVTEHKQTAAALERAQEELERRVEERTADLRALNAELEAFNYSVAHDLRTPLRGIDGFSQVLLEDYSDSLDATGRHYLARIQGAAERMGDLIDHLLDLSRLSTETVKNEHVDVSRLARTVVASLRIREPQRHVQTDIQDGMTARGDRALLKIVIENLLGNAWKFSGKRDHARIEMTAQQVDGEKIFLIRDNGAGFDMRYADRLFMAFQRLHSPNEFSGTGVGLAIVQRIVIRHGGRVWAESKVGEGASFYFTLPDDTGP